MRRIVILLLAIVLTQTAWVGRTLAQNETTSIILRPQKIVELSVADKTNYFPSGQYQELVGADSNSRLDATRADNPAWSTSASNYSSSNAWVGAKFTFDTKALLQCAQNGILRINQRGKYTATASSSNPSPTQFNDAKQYLASNGGVLQTIKFPGGLSPGTSKELSLTDNKINATRGQLNTLELISTIQVKDQTNAIDWSVDNISITVEYTNSCVSNSNRYNGPVFSEIDEFTNIPYRTTNLDNGQPVTLNLDVFRPKNDPVKFRPLIVFVHGGGYTWGTKEDINYAARWYARAGFTTASIDYRLITNSGPNPPIERILQALNDTTLDTKDAIRFLSNKSGAYGIDSNKVAVIGWSAGGATSLAQQLARTSYDSESARGNFSPTSHALISGSGYLGPPVFPEISAKKPNVLMINWQSDTANSDEMNQDNNSFARLTCDAFRSADVNCNLLLKPGSGHDIDFIHESTNILPFVRSQLQL